MSRQRRWSGPRSRRRSRKWAPKRAATSISPLALLRPRSCRLVAIGGLSGTGKSTLAAALAPSLGARVLRSDVIRKRLFDVAPETRLPASAYTSQVSRRVYRTLRRKAADALAAGYSVIIDAVSLKPEERQSFLAVAEAAGVPFAGLWLAAPATTMDRRLRARRHDASDASPEVLAQQLRQDPGHDGLGSHRCGYRPGRLPVRRAPRSRTPLIVGG